MACPRGRPKDVKQERPPAFLPFMTLWLVVVNNRGLRINSILFACLMSAVVAPQGRPGNTAVVEEGASLRIRWSDGVVDRPEMISLIPIDVALPRGLTRDHAIRMWTRAITGIEQRWDSLPHGTYQLVLRAANAETAASLPVEVGEVILGPGDDRAMSVALPPARTRHETRPAGTLRVLVPEDGPETETLTVSQWHEGTRSALTARRQQVSGGILLTMPASCVAGNVITIESSTKIGTASLDDNCEELVQMRLTERATVAARISVPNGIRTPKSGALKFSRCMGTGESVEIPFAISESRMRTNVPAGCQEMTLRASGFAPVRSASPPLKSVEIRDLGTVALREGAAAILRVHAGGDAAVLEGVRITALRARDLANLRGALEAESVALAQTMTDASGWARLTGLPEDRVVFLLQGRGRKHPHTSEPYELVGGEETVIDDLVVPEPANVHVTLSVPESFADALELSAIELHSSSHPNRSSRVPIRAEITPVVTVVEDVPPGNWIIRAEGRLKNGFALRIAETAIEVAAGEDRHVTLMSSDVLYHGRVTRGGKAIAGTINLQPADKRSSLRKAVAKVGRDGEFQVLLEEKGQYGVSVNDFTHRNSVTLDHYVTFDDPHDEIVIDLPTGRQIRGRVVDVGGSPVEGVSVSAEQQIVEPAGAVGSGSSSDGRFVLDGVVPGRWQLFAESKTERSDPVMVAVGESDVEGITLVVDSMRAVKVRLVDTTGAPLRFAGVDIEILAPGTMEPRFYGRLTDARGEVEFGLSHSQQTSPTNIVVRSLSDGRLSCDVRTLDSDQTIQVGSDAGEARLIRPRWMARPHTMNWLVSTSGCAVPFYAVVEDENIGRQAMVFKRLAAGRWMYVETRTREELAAVLTGRGSSLSPNKIFVVEPGKTTRVEISEN
jgi:hypothetical protein